MRIFQTNWFLRLKKKILAEFPLWASACLLIFITGTRVFAAPSPLPQGPETSNYSKLKHVIKDSAQAQEIQGRFQQKKTLKDLDISLETGGSFQIQRTSQQERTLFWNVEKPEVSRLCMNSSRIVLQSPQKQVLSLKELSGNTYDQILYLLNLLSFNFDYLQETFQLENQKNNWSFIPLPGKNFLFHKIDLEIQSGKIKTVQMWEKGGNSIFVQFDQVQYLNKAKIKDCQ